MALIQSKQISKFLLAFVGVAGFTTSATGTDAAPASTAILAALTTAGFGSTAVAPGLGNNTTEGVSILSPNNYVPIYKAGSAKSKLVDSGGNDIYAKLTGAASAYILTYYSAPGMVETAYTFPVATAIDFEIPYWFSFGDLPEAALIGVTERHVSPDQAVTTRIQVDVLVPSAVNTLPALSRIPTGVLSQVDINGVVIYMNATSGVSNSGVTLTVSAALLGYNIAVTDTVTASYAY